jgi:uncharacterized ferredoxin-like protein
MRYSGKDVSQEHLLDVAKHCVHAYFKAPQITGNTKLEAEIVTGDDLVPIIEMLGALAKINQFIRWDYETFKSNYDAGTPPVLVLLFGDLTTSQMGWDCGACGFPTCNEFNKYAHENKNVGQLWAGPSCNWKVIDYGIACDWAAAAAAQYKVDNRIQGDSGAVAAMLGYMPETSAYIGLPLGPTRDLVWWSRSSMTKKFSYEDALGSLFRTCPTHFGGFPGGGNPIFKNKDRWWESPAFNVAQEVPEAMDAVYEVLEEMADLVDKYGPDIGQKYQKA